MNKYQNLRSNTQIVAWLMSLLVNRLDNVLSPSITRAHSSINSTVSDSSLLAMILPNRWCWTGSTRTQQIRPSLSWQSSTSSMALMSIVADMVMAKYIQMNNAVEKQAFAEFWKLPVINELQSALYARVFFTVIFWILFTNNDLNWPEFLLPL